MGTCDSPDNDVCVVLKDPRTMAAADVPGTGTALADAGEVETNGISDNVLGREVLLTGVLLVSSGGRKTSSYFVRHPFYQLIQYSRREREGLWLNRSCT